MFKTNTGIQLTTSEIEKIQKKHTLHCTSSVKFTSTWQNYHRELCSTAFISKVNAGSIGKS